MRYMIWSLFVGLMLISGAAAAQGAPEQEQVPTYSSSKPLLLLQDGSKTYKLKSSDINIIDPEWVDEVQVLKQTDETEEFGEEGENGVVILAFKMDSKAAKKYVRQIRKQNEQVVNSIPKGVFRN